MTTLHVATTGADSADGSASRPLRTISRAAELAQPGDAVVVHEGEYREWVRPRRGGLSEQRRITYEAAPGERVVIKGSERVTGWEPGRGHGVDGVGAECAFRRLEPVRRGGRRATGWSSRSRLCAEASRRCLPELARASTRRARWRRCRIRRCAPRCATTGRVLSTGCGTPSRRGSCGMPRWATDTTTIWANFQGADPNAELVEINVRRSVFYPTEHHVDYITVRGFELAQAACPWAPPTADQPGLIGPNWAKGWIIEDNVIHDAKCSAVSLGKEASTGHNYATLRGDKPGYQYQLESVFAARQIGWDREHVGSHVVRRNTIYDCGQNGIVGHLGCVFSTIEDNHIYNIALKREFYGYEIAGIKLHAAIDVRSATTESMTARSAPGSTGRPRAPASRATCTTPTTGTCSSRSATGPTSSTTTSSRPPCLVESFSQGGAFVNNLLCGTLRLEPVLDRATPYHVPHSTQVAGYAVIYGGDDRYFGNMFLGGDVAAPTRPGRVRAAPRGIRHGRLPRPPDELRRVPRPHRRAATRRPHSASPGSSSPSTSAATSTRRRARLPSEASARTLTRGMCRSM